MTLKELAQEIKTIKDNHLAHMAEDIDRIEKKVEKVLFDRNGYEYHGRIKALAESAREAGLKF